MLLLTVGLIISRILFDVPMVGSTLLMYVYTTIYILVILGMGLFISNFTDTQQQAMFIAWFFVVIFILMSGLFTPIESMPDWAQFLTEFNPIKYYVEVMRMVMLKGSGFTDILSPFIKTSIYAVIMNGLAVWSYKKTN
jgi:ABC-2 type transport system permease protein